MFGFGAIVAQVSTMRMLMPKPPRNPRDVYLYFSSFSVLTQTQMMSEYYEEVAKYHERMLKMQTDSQSLVANDTATSRQIAALSAIAEPKPHKSAFVQIKPLLREESEIVLRLSRAYRSLGLMNTND